MIQSAYKKISYEDMARDIFSKHYAKKFYQYNSDLFSLIVFHKEHHGYYSVVLTDKRYHPIVSDIVEPFGATIEIMNAKTLDEIIIKLPDIVDELNYYPPNIIFDVQDNERYFFSSPN